MLNHGAIKAAALEGIRVLDITHVMAGPYCAMLMCDMGAEVIKVESPSGDQARHMAGKVGSDSYGFNAVNRGKRGMIVDLRKPEGQKVIQHLAKTVDVLVENNRPGMMAKYGLDYAALSALNPGLIYASISGYGQTGPYASKGGFDLVAQGISGIMSVTGEPGRPPVRTGVPVVDLGAGLFALVGILAALHHRTKTGQGQHIDTALLDTGLALSIWETSEYFSGSGIPQRLGSAHRVIAPYQAIACLDGYITLGVASDRLFAQLADVLGHPEWASSEEYATNAGRLKNRTELAEQIERITTTRSRAYWIERFDASAIPCGPINSYEESLADPQVAARSMVVEVEHPALGKIKTLGSAIKLSKTPTRVDRTAPLLGEHTEAILLEAGLTHAEIAALYAAGAIS
jgi:crotonobetainyl-CoA:carnitine CoA-transferase CaiB-like acyl-CoA transferase